MATAYRLVAIVVFGALCWGGGDDPFDRTQRMVLAVSVVLLNAKAQILDIKAKVQELLDRPAR